MKKHLFIDIDQTLLEVINGDNGYFKYIEKELGTPASIEDKNCFKLTGRVLDSVHTTKFFTKDIDYSKAPTTALFQEKILFEVNTGDSIIIGTVNLDSSTVAEDKEDRVRLLLLPTCYSEFSSATQKTLDWFETILTINEKGERCVISIFEDDLQTIKDMMAMIEEQDAMIPIIKFVINIDLEHLERFFTEVTDKPKAKNYIIEAFKSRKDSPWKR